MIYSADPKVLDRMAGQMVAGDERAYREFAEYFGPRLRAFYRSQGLSVTDAEDLAVSCITDICLRIDKYKPQGNLNAWVYTLARRTAIDWWRKENQGKFELFADITTLLRDSLRHKPAEDPEESSAVLCVQDALSKLGTVDRTIIQMHHLGGDYKHAEIASALNLSTGAVRVRYLRAKSKLKCLLEEDPWLGPRLKGTEMTVVGVTADGETAALRVSPP